LRLIFRLFGAISCRNSPRHLLRSIAASYGRDANKVLAGFRFQRDSQRMELLIIILVLVLLCGGGGYAYRGPAGGGGGLGLVLIILLVLYLTGNL
jgi:hypothetical protein